MSGRSPVDDLPFAWGGPAGKAQFRTCPQDFRVDELMDLPEHPGGAHWWLQLEKTGMNTKQVAQLLCSLGSARIRQVGYAGLKDRHAVTRQWFSLPIETLAPENLKAQMPDELRLLDVRRCRKAIRRGGFKANCFVIRLREFSGNTDQLKRRIDAAKSGVPNYFGPQRFGNGGQNLKRGRALLSGSLGRVPRHERGLYLSALRSHLFNRVLAARVKQGNWNRLLPGEAINLAGSRSCFTADARSSHAELAERLAGFDIHPSGPLVGVGSPLNSGDSLLLEQNALAPETDLADGLRELGMRAERRPLRLVPEGLEVVLDGADVNLRFELVPGGFATCVLRELVILDARS